MKRLFYFLILINTTIVGQKISYFEHITTKNDLPSNFIFCTEIDQFGYIWAGTDKGICKYNGATWQNWNIENGLPGNYVTKIYPCKNGGLWISISEKGLYHIDENVQSIVPAFENSLLFQFNLNNTNGELNGVNQTSKTANIVTVLWENNKAKPTFTNQTNSTSIEQTNRNIIDLLDSKTSKILKKQSIEKIKLLNKFNEYLFNNSTIINCRVGLKDTILWKMNKSLSSYYDTATIQKKSFIALAGVGLFELNNKNYKLYNQTNGLQNLTINDIRADKNNDLYISTHGGGIFILPNKPKIVVNDNGLSIRQIQFVESDQYFIDNQYFSKINKDYLLTKYKLESEPLCFFVDEQFAYIGDFKGITTYNISGNQFKKVRFYPMTVGISSILKKNNQILYSTYGNGITILNKEEYKINSSKKAPFNNIEKLYSINYGLVALSYEAGFYICDNKFEKIKHFKKENGLLDNYCSSMCFYNDTMLIGNKGGITILKQGKIVGSISYKNGFIGKLTRQIFRTKNGIVYVVSDVAIHIYINNQLQTIGNELIRLNKNEYINSVEYNTNKNKMSIATTSRFFEIGLDDVSLTKALESLKLKSIQIEKIAIKSFFDFDVPYNNKQISFQFLPTKSSLITNNKNFYKLNNLEWIAINEDGKIELKQLRWGFYQLFTKSKNANGIYSKEQLVASFTILKPWWLQWWFLMLSFIIIFFTIWHVLKRWNKKKVIKEQIQLQKLELERQRISRDLHDNMGAFTSALIANVQHLKLKIGENKEIEKMQNNAEQILNSLRETIWVLKNKEIYLSDFSEGFKNYAFKVLKNFEEIDFDSQENINQNILLPTNVAVHLNKIMQEAVQNIIKHAKASKMNYSIQFAENLKIEISDNGIGLDVNNVENGNGLENMAWRAKEANLELKIKPNKVKGTIISIEYNPNVKI